MKVHSALAKGLVDNGIDTIFGLVGDANLFFADSFVRDYNGTFVSAAHEAGATLMAYGYGSTSGRLGVVSVTHGPGLTNTLTGLVEAVKARTPLLLICGDTATEDRYGPQVVEQRDLILPTGAGVEQVRSPRTVVEDLAIAIRRAHLEQRPIALNVPAEFLPVEIEYEAVDYTPVASPAAQPDDASLDRAVGIIAAARRPIVLAGRGATDARESLLRLAKRIGAPVATSLRAKDLFRDEPFNLGIFGTLSGPAALEAIYQADCIVAFGAGLNRYTTALGSLLANKSVVHCDVDAARLGNFSQVDAPIVGDAGEIADLIVDWLDQADIPAASFRSVSLARGLAGGSKDEVHYDAKRGTIDIREALDAIDQAVAPDRTFVTDAGRFITMSWTHIHVSSPRSFVFPVNFGSIGTGLATAIGAAYALPDRPVLMVCGDGGFMLGGLTEFNSAVRHGIDMIVVVCNDGAYGAEHIQLVNQNMTPEISEFNWPDFAPIADALGGRGITVRDSDDLNAAVKLIATRDRPLLIDVKLDPHSMPDVQH